MGVSDGVWECGKPKRFSIISMPQSEGEKGEVTFSLRPRREQFWWNAEKCSKGVRPSWGRTESP